MFIKDSINSSLKRASNLKYRIFNWFDEPKWLNRISLYLIFFALVYIIFKSIFSYFDFMHTDVDSARYMLSALIQGEFAVVALIISLSLIAIQLAASSYSARVVEVFKRTPDLWILIGIYGFSIFFGLGVLKLIEASPQENSLSTLEGHISLVYYLGVFAFVALIPYIWKTLELLKPSTVIDILSKRITKQIILTTIKIEGRFNQPIIETEKDPIQPIIDIIRGSLMKYDYETVRYGLKVFEKRIEYILIYENFNEKNEEIISKHIFNHLLRIGKLTANRQDEDSTIEIMNTIFECGEKVVENRLEFATSHIISSLGGLGIASIKEKFKNTDLIITALGIIGRKAAEYNLDHPTSLSATSFRKIGELAAEYEFENLTHETIIHLVDIGKKSAKNNLKKATLYTIVAFGGVGEKAAKNKFENSLYSIVFGLNGVIEEIAKQNIQENLSSISMAIVSLEKIGITSSENQLENVTQEVTKSLTNVIKIAEKYKLIDELDQAEQTLKNINEVIGKFGYK